VHGLFRVADPETAIVVAETLLAIVLDDPRVMDPITAWVATLEGLCLPSDISDCVDPHLAAVLPSPPEWVSECLQAVTRELIVLTLAYGRGSGAPSVALAIEWAIAEGDLLVPGAESLRDDRKLMARIRRAVGSTTATRALGPQGEAALRRGVEWWWSQRTKQAPTHKLARQLRGTQEPRASDGRATVKAAIRRADRVIRQIGTGGPGVIALRFGARGKREQS